MKKRTEQRDDMHNETPLLISSILSPPGSLSSTFLSSGPVLYNAFKV